MTVWEESRDFPGALRALFRTPTGFFRTVEPAGRVGPPLLFGVLAGSIGSVATILWQTAATLLGLNAMEGPGSPSIGLLGAALWCLVAPLGVLAGILVGGALNHVGLTLVGGARYGIGATLSATAYAQAPQVLAMVPVCGALVGGVWSLGLTVAGLREVHQTTTLRALVAVLLPIVVCLGLAAAVVIVAFRMLHGA